MAKKLGIVHCRCCKGDINRETQKEDIDWIMRSKGWYYHKKCYEDWVAKKDELHAIKDESEWLDYTWDYLTRDIKIGMEYLKFKNQWDNFLKKKMTAKGIYFCLRYFYDVQKGSKEKSQGGIGIVPYIYQEGCSYWVEREKKEKGICEQIAAQLRQRAEKEDIVKTNIKTKKEKKLKFSLDMIEAEEDE